MRVIYKYEIEIDRNSMMLPIGAKILHVECQNGTPYLWGYCRS